MRPIVSRIFMTLASAGLMIAHAAHGDNRPLLDVKYRFSIVCETKDFTWTNAGKGSVMHSVTRTYSGKGAKELIDAIEKNKGDVERLLRSINGLVSYSLVRTADGGYSVSVYQDKTGIDESVRVSRDWIAKNASNIGATAPTVLQGAVIMQLK